MALFDDAVSNKYLSNFKGYVGNPPTTKEEYDAFEGWIDKSSAPTWEQIQSEIEVINVQLTRAKQYPSINEQLDMLWHAIDSGTLDKNSDFYQTIKTVKDSNPKPGV